MVSDGRSAGSLAPTHEACYVLSRRRPGTDCPRCNQKALPGRQLPIQLCSTTVATLQQLQPQGVNRAASAAAHPEASMLNQGGALQTSHKPQLPPGLHPGPLFGPPSASDPSLSRHPISATSIPGRRRQRHRLALAGGCLAEICGQGTLRGSAACCRHS